MSKKFLIITVFISNIVFATVIPVPLSPSSTKNNTINSLSSMATLNLYKRGLDKDVAEQKVLDTLSGDTNLDDLMAQNIVVQLEAIEREDIINFVSNAALYGKNIDFSSYETLISLLQKSNKVSLDKDILAKVQKISLENKNIKSIYS